MQRINLFETKPDRRAIVEVKFLPRCDAANASLCIYFPANNDISLICTHKAPSLTVQASGGIALIKILLCSRYA